MIYCSNNIVWKFEASLYALLMFSNLQSFSLCNFQNIMWNCEALDLNISTRYVPWFLTIERLHFTDDFWKQRELFHVNEYCCILLLKWAFYAPAAPKQSGKFDMVWNVHGHYCVIFTYSFYLFVVLLSVCSLAKIICIEKNKHIFKGRALKHNFSDIWSYIVAWKLKSLCSKETDTQRNIESG